MKLSSLELINFRSHANTKINLEHINIFVGPGGAGKSSIKAAIEYLLTGRCQWTDRAGKEAEELIRDGAKKSSIKAEMNPFGTVTRYIPNALEIRAINGSLTVLQEEICKRLKADKDVISAMINTDKFITMTPDEQKKMLFALMGFKFNRDSVRVALSEYLAKTGQKDMTKQVLAEFDRLYPKDLSGGSEVLDTLYKMFYEERTAANKALKTAKTFLEIEHNSRLPEGVTVHDKEEVIKQLLTLKDRKNELLVQIGQANNANQQRDALVKRIETNKQELSVAENQMNGLPQPEDIDYQGMIDDINKKLQKARKALEDANSKYVEANGAVNELAKAMSAIYESGENCPLAPEHVKCSMTKEQKDKILDDMDGQLAKLKTNRSKAEKAVKDAAGKVQELEKELAEATHKAQEAARITAEAIRLENLVNDLAKRIAEDEAMLQQLPEPVDTAALQALDQRIPKGEALLQAIIAEESALQEREKHAEKLAQLEDRVGALNILVKAFDSKGIKAEKLAGVVDKLQARANERLLMLTCGQYQVSFDTSEDFKIVVTKTGTGPRKINKLSKSEEKRVGIILQDVLNQLTGLRFLVIDDANDLDAKAKAALVQTLLQIKDDYDTILVFSTLGETAPRNPGIPGLAMFEVNDGTVTPIPVEKKEGAVA